MTCFKKKSNIKLEDVLCDTIAPEGLLNNLPVILIMHDTKNDFGEKGPHSLVITDLTMPIMSGYRVADELLQI